MPPVFDKYVIDTYSPLSHKVGLDSAGVGPGSWSPSSWVGPHARRLIAYKILSALINNVARLFADIPEEDRKDRREYGDAAALVAALVGALLGDEQTVVVDGSGDDVPTDEQGAEDPAEAARITAAQDREEWLLDWFDDEHAIRKIGECEAKSVGLGDGVYVLRWSNRKKRPLLRIYDPGFYFPVMSDSDEDEFPTTVHLAWQEDITSQAGVTETWVRRITYRLGPLEQSAATHAGDIPVTATDKIVTWIEPSPDANLEGRTVRRLPYHGPDDDPTAITCYLSDGRWLLNDVGSTGLADLSEAKAQWLTNDEGLEIRNLDLAIDFLPVVHEPNTSAEEEHYGRSALLSVAQIFDDLAAVDTDLSKASGTTGFPPIVLKNATAGDLTYRPGKIFNVGADGGLDVIDTSHALDALLKYGEALQDRLSTNSRVPAAVLGRVDPSKIASGILLALSFGPLSQVVKEMRLVRSEKLPLIPRFAQRLAIVGGVLDAPVLDAEIKFGSFLPSDKSAMVEMVRRLIGNGIEPALISRQEGIAMLVEVGFGIEDAAAELEQIEHEDFAGAARLLDATGDEDAVFEFLGRTRPVPPPPPPVAPGTPPVVAPGAADLNAPPSNLPPQPPAPGA